jgi:hypothetical protein
MKRIVFIILCFLLLSLQKRSSSCESTGQLSQERGFLVFDVMNCYYSCDPDFIKEVLEWKKLGTLASEDSMGKMMTIGWHLKIGDTRFYFSESMVVDNHRSKYEVPRALLERVSEISNKFSYEGLIWRSKELHYALFGKTSGDLDKWASFAPNKGVYFAQDIAQPSVKSGPYLEKSIRNIISNNYKDTLEKLGKYELGFLMMYVDGEKYYVLDKYMVSVTNNRRYVCSQNLLNEMEKFVVNISRKKVWIVELSKAMLSFELMAYNCQKGQGVNPSPR